jgi:hypothetical protein
MARVLRWVNPARAPRSQYSAGDEAVKIMADPTERNDAAEAAIARVLAAERDARASIEQAHAQVHHIAESARTAVRSLGERTEHRIRRVVNAFERELAARLAEIEAEAASLESPQPISGDEREALQRALATLVRQTIGASP